MLKRYFSKLPDRVSYALTAALIIGMIGIGTWFFRTFLIRDGVDWALHFYPDTRNWLEGNSLLFDEKTAGFYHPPWGIWYIAPFALMRYDIGISALRSISVAMIIACVWAFTDPGRQRLWGVILAVFNLHAFDLIFRGQITGFDALGAALAWQSLRKQSPWLLGFAYVTLSVSPPNTLPFAVVIIIYCWNHWERRRFWQSLLIPLLVGLLSFVVFLDWPVRWIDNVMSRPPGDTPGATWFTTIWWGARMLHLPVLIPWIITAGVVGVTYLVWKKINADQDRPPLQRLLGFLMLFTAAVFLITPWALSYRYVLIYAMIIPWLVGWRLEAALLAHVLSYLPLLRTVIGVEHSYIDIIYVAVVFVLTLIYVAKPYKNKQHDPSVSGLPPAAHGGTPL